MKSANGRLALLFLRYASPLAGLCRPVLELGWCTDRAARLAGVGAGAKRPDCGNLVAIESAAGQRRWKAGVSSRCKVCSKSIPFRE